MALSPADLLADLTVLLGGQVEQDRAELVVDLALQRVASVVNPIPDAARPILLDVIERGYSNPRGVESRTVGPFTERFRNPGVYLLDQEREDLLALVTTTRSGGAFTIRAGAPDPLRVLDTAWPGY